ncbi:DUF1793 domain containing protein [Lactarius tabidus]
MTFLLSAILLLSLVQYGAQQLLFPAAIPLAVRSPYLSGWDFTTNGTTIGKLWSTTSQTGSNSSPLSIPVHVRVDNITYSFLGASAWVNGSVNLTNIVISPTQTKLTAEAGPMQFNLTFLNPIEPGDWVKQSIPFSYLSLTAESLDGAAHALQVYSDVSGQWLSGDPSQEIEWSTTSNDNVIYHTAELQNPAVFNEINTQADWGTLYYAMKSVGNITFKTDIGGNCRVLFQLNGTLDNGTLDSQTNSTFGPIGTLNQLVFAISRDLGTIQTTQDPVVWTIGLTTNPAIQYQDPSADSPQQRSLYYKTQYPSDTSLIPDFLNDFANASSRAQQFDSKILGDAATVSGTLGDLVSLATAQIYGSIQLTIGSDAGGNLNKSDVMAFMKNIGGPGLSTNRVNAVETLYAAFPAFMYIDPNLGGLLLEPLFQLQASSSYRVPYAAADLGSNYPNVTISNSYHSQGVERLYLSCSSCVALLILIACTESGNMLIMTYAYARASGDGSLISRYYSLLTSWADYLSNYTLYSADETSADGLTTNNQTNLAIKGIIAIEAMSKMSSVVKKTADADKYSVCADAFDDTASGLYTQWKGLALASDQHLVAIYGFTNLWTLGYNLFADVWLSTSVVESSVYDGQSSFINNIALTSSFSNYGIPIDNYNTDTSTAASTAMTTNQDLRTSLISRVHNRASFNMTAGVFPVLYDSNSGLMSQGGASPAQGAMYAPLALKVPVRQITANPVTTGASSNSNSPRNSQSHASAIAGGAIGAAVLLAIGAALLARRRSRRRKLMESSLVKSDLPTTVTPFNPTLLHASTPSDSPVSSSRVAPPPVGLSSKELARLRQDSSRPQSTDASPPGPLSTTAESGVATTSSEARRLQTEVESLRREMQQLRVERFEAPPGYEG